MSQSQNITQDNFKVIIRLRPLNTKQQQQITAYQTAQSKRFKNSTQNNNKMIKLSPSAYSFYTKFYNVTNLNQIMKVENKTIYVVDTEYKNTQKKLKPYVFSNVYNHKQTSQEIFNDQVRDQIQCIFQGFNYTVLAYGITGSGKTHTVFGNHQKNQKGISNLALDYLLNHKKHLENNINAKINLKFSFVEIYNQNVRDLLSNDSKMLNIIQDTKGNTTFTDAIQIDINSQQQISEIINIGLAKRSLGATMANQYSSRSHAIIQVNVQIITQDKKINSKMFIIDLAGSEKLQTLNCSKKMLQGANINKSLLALGNCINILAENSKKGSNNSNIHIPYRDSKLTRILKDSLGGNAKTLMISCVSSNPFTIEETITTLNYSQRAQGIKKQIKRNLINDQTSNQAQKICGVCFKQMNEEQGFQVHNLKIPQNLLQPSSKDQLFQTFFNQIYDDILQNIKQKYAIQAIMTQKSKNPIQNQVLNLKQVNQNQRIQLKETMFKLFSQKQHQYQQKLQQFHQFVDKVNKQNLNTIENRKKQIKKKNLQQYDSQNNRITNDLWYGPKSCISQQISNNSHIQKYPLSVIQNSSCYIKPDQSIKFLLQGSSSKSKVMSDCNNINSRFSFATLLDSNIKNYNEIQNGQNQTQRNSQLITRRKKSRSKFQIIRRNSASKSSDSKSKLEVSLER